MPTAQCHGTGDFGVFGAGRPDNQPESSGPEGGGITGGEPAGRLAYNGSGSGGPAALNPRPRGTARPSGRPVGLIIGVGLAAAAVVAAGVTYAVTRPSGGSGPSKPAALGAPNGPMRVMAVTPATQSTGVDGASPIVISFSDPVAANSPHPQLQPSVPGTWSAQGYAMVFTPSVPFGPSTTVTVSIPEGASGVRSASGVVLADALTVRFTTGGYPQLALSELLAEQGYLPMTFSPTSNGATRAQSTQDSVDPASLTAAGEAYSPPSGTFTFDPGYPSSLQAQWNPNAANVLLRGAVMAFESEHNMTVDGDLTAKFWNALFLAQQRGERNQNGYTYAVADQRDPETLTIYHDGHVVLRSPTNTGIPDSPTVNGTFPVYQKYRFQIMSGTNPGGSTYSDPVSFVSYFNGGDAVHYFPRPGYGYQQSLGCVELPYTAAERAYPYLTYGSLVTVMG